MKKRKLRVPAYILVMLAVAVGLLLFSAVGGARAALTYYSQVYTSEFEMYHIGITLLENNKEVNWRNYKDEAWHVGGSERLLDHIEEFRFGETYDEELKVRNSGSIDEYIRVTVRRYWTDANGKKLTNLDPDLIQLHFTENSGWVQDASFKDPERTVLYYTTPVSIGAETAAFADSLTVDSAIKAKVTQTKRQDGEYTVITTTYDYNGAHFNLEVEADGVQTHNAEDAILSAWGRSVSVAEDGTLSLK